MDVVGFEEKPVYRSHVNAGIYVINPTALSMLEPGERCDMPTLFDRLSNRGERTIAFPMHESWLDVGRPADLEQARRAFT
jgi:NDP-sugar pyrophosphorylase family protein